MAESIVGRGEPAGVRPARIAVPDIRRNGIATVARVADDASRLDMRLPVLIDVAGHLHHPPRHLLGVNAVVGKIFSVVAIGAALLRSDPGGHRSHQRVELIDAEVRQHLHVLVDVGRAGAVRRGFGNRVGHRIEGLQLLDGGRRRDLVHAGSPEADLRSDNRRMTPACGEQHRDRQEDRGDHAKQGKTSLI